MTGSKDIVKKTSAILVKDFTMYIDSMQYGRNIFENLRKFVQFQLACTVNLVIFVSLGSFIHKDSPMSPPLILWMNCLIDTIAAAILASEVPASKEVTENFLKDPDYESILDRTSPYDSTKDPIFSRSMWCNVISASVYMQAVLVYIYYHGKAFWLGSNPESGPDNWHHYHSYEENEEKVETFQRI
jgi:Ca2+ transporting ATPase